MRIRLQNARTLLIRAFATLGVGGITCVRLRRQPTVQGLRWIAHLGPDPHVAWRVRHRHVSAGGNSASSESSLPAFCSYPVRSQKVYERYAQCPRELKQPRAEIRLKRVVLLNLLKGHLTIAPRSVWLMFSIILRSRRRLPIWPDHRAEATLRVTPGTSTFFCLRFDKAFTVPTEQLLNIDETKNRARATACVLFRTKFRIACLMCVSTVASATRELSLSRSWSYARPTPYVAPLSVNTLAEIGYIVVGEPVAGSAPWQLHPSCAEPSTA
jgi:hypothetical protein